MSHGGPPDPAAELRRLREAAAAVGAETDLRPLAAVLLGTGLGALGEALEIEREIPYGRIPHLTEPTIEGHEWRLILGHLEGVPTALFHGRLHLYEGHAPHDVVFPVRLAGLLGAEILVSTGIAGGMNPLWDLGDLVLLHDHLNLTGHNPLVGANLDELGPRFPDMSEPYDRELQELALREALAAGIQLRRGVYAAVLGPNVETRAEYRMLRALGADVVGMSTVPEVIAARHLGLRVLGLVAVTDLCLPDALEPVDVGRILRVAAEADPRMAAVIRGVLGSLHAARRERPGVVATAPRASGQGE